MVLHDDFSIAKNFKISLVYLFKSEKKELRSDQKLIGIVDQTPRIFIKILRDEFNYLFLEKMENESRGTYKSLERISLPYSLSEMFNIFKSRILSTHLAIYF